MPKLRICSMSTSRYPRPFASVWPRARVFCSSLNRFTIARLRNRNSANAPSHGEMGTRVAAEPASIRSVYSPDSRITSTSTTRLKYSE